MPKCSGLNLSPYCYQVYIMISLTKDVHGYVHENHTKLAIKAERFLVNDFNSCCCRKIILNSSIIIDFEGKKTCWKMILRKIVPLYSKPEFRLLLLSFSKMNQSLLILIFLCVYLCHIAGWSLSSTKKNKLCGTRREFHFFSFRLSQNHKNCISTMGAWEEPFHEWV